MAWKDEAQTLIQEIDVRVAVLKGLIEEAETTPVQPEPTPEPTPVPTPAPTPLPEPTPVQEPTPVDLAPQHWVMTVTTTPVDGGKVKLRGRWVAPKGFSGNVLIAMQVFSGQNQKVAEWDTMPNQLIEEGDEIIFERELPKQPDGLYSVHQGVFGPYWSPQFAWRADGFSVSFPAPVVTVPGTNPVPVPVPTDTGDLTQTQLNLTGANWLGEWSGRNPFEYVRRTVQQAGDRTPLFIGYFMYGRDNGNFSAGGAHSEDEFISFYKAVAEAIGNEDAWVVVEPDALGLLPALSPTQAGQRLYLLVEAIKALSAKPNIKVYLDASTWIDAQQMGERLKAFVSSGVDGFSLNVSGYLSTEETKTWAEKVAQVSGLHYVLDTSRNGRGNPHPPAWCNVTDTLVGLPPTTKTHSRNCDAYLWCKVPGESDGLKINGHDQDGQPNRGDVPPAGAYWPEFKEAIYSGNWSVFKTKYRV